MRFSGELAKTPICSGNLHKTDFGLRIREKWEQVKRKNGENKNWQNRKEQTREKSGPCGEKGEGVEGENKHWKQCEIKKNNNNTRNREANETKKKSENGQRTAERKQQKRGTAAAAGAAEKRKSLERKPKTFRGKWSFEQSKLPRDFLKGFPRDCPEEFTWSYLSSDRSRAPPGCRQPRSAINRQQMCQKTCVNGNDASPRFAVGFCKNTKENFHGNSSVFDVTPSTCK
ncbi:hypothetical protein RUM43_007642 [Polyplax serrata]|uniref:Uncharacterized protein n=1 Tax=Polyplax serrata TaxID=468196 RepID=A0AAN8P291_POLSC